MSGSVQLWGVPERLDAVWRPIARAVFLAIGILGSLILVWLSAWLWVPAPLLVAVLLYEGVFWLRGDRPIDARLDGSRLRVIDRKGDLSFTLDLSEAAAAGIGVRRGRGLDDVVVVLYDTAGVLGAFRLHTKSREWPPFVADLDALQPVLGGRPNLLRALAPPGRLVRQVLPDYDGRAMDHLLSSLPEPATKAAAARIWRGEAPPMDFMGHHLGEPSALLLIHTSGWRCGGDRGPLSTCGGGRATRCYEQLSYGEEPAPVVDLHLLMWSLEGGITLAIPSSLAGRHGPELPLGAQTAHLHLPEAANIVWFLLRHLDPGELPEGLKQGLRSAAAAVDPLPEILGRHLTDELNPEV